jgi:Na+-translocating ferredoxin:NAD+ oxidoreductase subunit B
MHVDAYELLALALDRLPNAFPRTKSGVELRILKRIFSPQEAIIASNMTGDLETAATIANRINLPEKESTEIMKAMLKRGVIWGAKSRKDDVWKFRLAPYVIGFWESQVETMDLEYAQLCEQYWVEGGGEGIMRYQPALHRVVPALHAISPEYILPYDDIKPLILASKSFEVHDCICRKQKDLLNERECDFPLKICFNFSQIERPVNLFTISQKEAIRLLDEAEEVGLVHTVSNVAEGITYVCNCCGCCCGVLRGITKFGLEGGVAKANYHAVVNAENCTACGICEDRCQVGACQIHENVAAVDLSKCIGCGICVTGCPSEAMTLKLKPDASIVPPPTNFKAWEQERLHNRGLL